MKLEIVNRTRLKIPSGMIISDIRKILLKARRAKNKKASPPKLTIVFVSEAESKFLNSRFLKKDRPANVLSFHYGSEAELILAPSLIRRQAASARSSYAKELRRMAIHGLLHVLGHHHEASRRAARVFERQERQILQRLNIDSD